MRKNGFGYIPVIILILGLAVLGMGVWFINKPAVTLNVETIPVVTPAVISTPQPTLIPIASPTPSPKPTIQAAVACSQMTGYSVTSEIFWGAHVNGGGGANIFQNIVGDNNWQLYWGSGGAISRYANPNDSIWSHQYPSDASIDPTAGYQIMSACSANSTSPSVWVHMISDTSYNNDYNYWKSKIIQTINNIHAKYPSVKKIYLQPIAGMANSQTCPTSDPQSEHGVIRATYNFAAMNQAISQIIDNHQFADVLAGFVPLVRSCSDYADWGGHINTDAAAYISAKMGNFYASK